MPGHNSFYRDPSRQGSAPAVERHKPTDVRLASVKPSAFIGTHYFRIPYPLGTMESLCDLCGQPGQSGVHTTDMPTMIRLVGKTTNRKKSRNG